MIGSRITAKYTTITLSSSVLFETAEILCTPGQHCIDVSSDVMIFKRRGKTSELMIYTAFRRGFANGIFKHFSLNELGLWTLGRCRPGVFQRESVDY